MKPIVWPWSAFDKLRKSDSQNGTEAYLSSPEMMLAELLTARICHDLSGPVGAVAAGAELMTDDGGVDAEALGLLAVSAQAAIARLKFFRAAFGPGNAIEPAKLRELIAAFLAADGRSGGHGAVGLDWPGLWTLPADLSRLVMNLVLVAHDCLPRGGTIRVSCDLAELVVAEGPRAALHSDVCAVMEISSSPTTPRGAQAWFSVLESRSLGYDLIAQNRVETVSIGVKRA